MKPSFGGHAEKQKQPRETQMGSPRPSLLRVKSAFDELLLRIDERLESAVVDR